LTASSLRKGIDIIKASDGVLNLTAVQGLSLGDLQLTGFDTVTLLDTSAHIAGLTADQIAALFAKGFDSMNASDDVLTLSVAQVVALGLWTFTTSDAVTVEDTGANLALLEPWRIRNLASAKVDFIKASDGALSLKVAQYSALGTIKLAATDIVTLLDTGANLSAMTAAQFATLAANGVDAIKASDGILFLSAAQANALGPVSVRCCPLSAGTS
jgi:hypothetical protein